MNFSPESAIPLWKIDADKSVRSIVSGIVSYTRWPSLSGQPKLCVYASSHYTQALSSEEGQSELPYTRFNVTTEAKQSRSQINVMVMMTLIMLIRLNVLLNVGRGVEVISLSMLLIPE